MKGKEKIFGLIACIIILCLGISGCSFSNGESENQKDTIFEESEDKVDEGVSVIDKTKFTVREMSLERISSNEGSYWMYGNKVFDNIKISSANRRNGSSGDYSISLDGSVVIGIGSILYSNQENHKLDVTDVIGVSNLL